MLKLLARANQDDIQEAVDSFAAEHDDVIVALSYLYDNAHAELGECIRKRIFRDESPLAPASSYGWRLGHTFEISTDKVKTYGDTIRALSTRHEATALVVKSLQNEIANDINNAVRVHKKVSYLDFNWLDIMSDDLRLALQLQALSAAAASYIDNRNPITVEQAIELARRYTCRVESNTSEYYQYFELDDYEASTKRLAEALEKLRYHGDADGKGSDAADPQE